MMRGRYWLVVSVLFCLLGCGQKTSLASNVPMLSGSTGGPWPVQTYDGDQVQWDVLSPKPTGGFEPESKSVYLSDKSQFVLRDGTPITTFDGQAIFWNIDGFIITSKLVKIPENTVFSVKGKAMKNGTAMKVSMPITRRTAPATTPPVHKEGP